jgi:pimeloyl-ACP methyl ester carboxylesterase
MGHSFGGLLSMYLAANYPDRVERLVIVDAAASMNPNAAEMLGPTLSRLEKQYPSKEAYLDEIRNAPFNDPWDDNMISYYEADIMETEAGGVTPRPTLHNMIEASMGVRDTPWMVLIRQIMQPALLLNALDNYTLGEPLLPESKARETAEAMRHCTYKAVDGNHHTMLYGRGASQIVGAVREFMKQPGGAA